MIIIKDELFFNEEHRNCFLYDGGEDPIISYVTRAKGETIYINEKHSRIFFLIKGRIKFTYMTKTPIVFKEGTFILLPRGCKYVMCAEEDASLVIVRLHHRINFCNHFPLEMLFELNEELKINTSTLTPLQIKTMISIYLDNLLTTIASGLKCSHLHEIRQRELLYYLRAYYSKAELIAFFAPILNEDSTFAELIYQHYEAANSVAELADLTHYSLSGFKKRFVRVFGISPHAWMKKEQAKKIHYEINCTQKSLKEIASEYNFYSMSHFNIFCNKMYGVSPSVLRKHTMCIVSMDKTSDK